MVGRKVRSWSTRLAVILVVIGFQVVSSSRHSFAATVAELVKQAKKEGALNAMVITAITGKTTPQLATAFKKRFGLDIDVTLTPLLNTTEYPKAVAETKAGVVPTYDVLEGSDTNNIALLGVGGIHRVDGWENLLREINPLVRAGRVKPEVLSHGPLRGFVFAYLSRTKALLYNPRLITKDKLPKTHEQLADPRYKGMWNQPPWTTHWEPGPLVFPNISKDKWVEIVRKTGKNAGAVVVESAGVQRVLVGEHAFTMANTYYYFLYKAKDPQAPIDITYFQDFNVSSRAYYCVRKNAKHIAAGTLFAFWMATPEAQAIWQPANFYTQLWGESDLDKKEIKFIEDSGAKIVDFLDSEEGLAYLNWMSTEEGRKFKEAIGRAIRGE